VSKRFGFGFRPAHGDLLLALDRNDDQIRFNHAIAAWRLGDALRRSDRPRALSAYDEAIGILRPLKAKRFNRDVPLAAALSESAATLTGLGRSAESAARLEEAEGICETYRGVKQVVYETCAEFTTRARAAIAMSRKRPADAVAAHREWLALSGAENETDEIHQDLFSAYVLSRRYRLLADALRAAGQTAEAQHTEASRRALIDWWRTKLSGRNNAELYLSQ
jgi:hypothetical protein